MKMLIGNEWCKKMAELEEGHSVEAGVISDGIKMKTDEKTIKQFTRIIFNRAFTLGWFVGGDPKKLEESYSMMVNDIQDSFVNNEIKKLIDLLKD